MNQWKSNNRSRAKCSSAAASDYPADVVVDYFSRGLFFSGVRRVKAGTRDVVTRLTNNVSKLILGHQVESIAPAEDGVRIKLEGHEALHFDHVILATQANQALELVAPEFKRERAILEKFPYESSRVTMHRDTALAPKSKRDWSPVNFILKKGSAKPMATIWMNRENELIVEYIFPGPLGFISIIVILILIIFLNNTSDVVM